jgi:8-oxo-dGTP pyrophosphatase MutT (NUDIX family)
MWKKNNNIRTNKIYCGNCGDAGHIYRNCRQPITSFGIILLKYDEIESSFDVFNNLKFLMIQRKDSISYVEFIRGKYLIDKSTYISRLFSDMTPQERYNLQNYDFKELWNKLWMNHDSNIFKNEFEISFEKFNTLKKGIINKENVFISIDKFIEKTQSKYNTPEWEFPKGRRNIREEDIKCARREFEEETAIEKSSYFLLDFIPPFQELFTGSNNIKYRIVYYIGIYKSNKEISVNPNNITQASEIGNIGWFNFENAIKIIKPHFLEKKKVITSIFYLFMSIMETNNYKNIINNDEETFQSMSSIVSRSHRPLKQFYSKNSKFYFKNKRESNSNSDSDDSDKNMQ